MGHFFSILKPPAVSAAMLLLALPIPTEAAGSFRKLNQALAGLSGAGAGLSAEPGCEALPREENAAASAGLCGDLYRFSCAPGEWNDGTGRAGDDELVREKVGKLKADLAKKAAKNFAELLSSPKGAYLRRVALSAFGMTHAPTCKNAAGSKGCNLTLAKALATQVTKNLFPRGGPGGPGGPGGRPASLRDLDLLTQNAQYRRLEKRFKAEAKLALRDQNAEAKIEKKIFPEVRKMLVNLLRRKVPDPKVREILVTKVSGIEFDGTDCASPVPPDATGDSYNPSLSAMLEPNAYYTPAKNTFRFCNGFLLRNKSEFQIASVVAHELAHAIDPCLIGHGPRDFRFDYSDPLNREVSEQEYPLPNLLGCLRGEDSVQASFLPPGMNPEGESRGAASPSERVKALEEKIARLNKRILDKATTRKERESLRDEKTLSLNELARAQRILSESLEQEGEGGPPPPENAFCEQDQIGESVADWISGEILPAYIKKHYPKLSREQRQTGFANVFRGMCAGEEMFPGERPRFDVHPDSFRRANFLLLAQPQVRRQMGCPLDPPAGVTYCHVPDVRGAK
jgi:hypothetical protein